MGYRAILGISETVQDTALSATRRLDESFALFVHGRYHAAIYLGGLAAEMFLKTACYYLEGASPADQAAVHFEPLRSKKYQPPFKSTFESGHGLWFWSQELLARRRTRNLTTDPGFLGVMAALYDDWFVGMRYMPGAATAAEAAAFITNVEWIADHHHALRS